MTNPDPDTLRDIVVVASDLAKEAGELLARGYRAGSLTSRQVRKKGAIDLVTDYDLRSEELICERLARVFPDHAIIAEEAHRQSERPFTWYVDPIDGTTNFAHGHPFFAVSLGLYFEDVPVVGVVHAPVLGTCWTAAAGQGAFRNSETCRVSATSDLGDALCATGFPYDSRTSRDNNYREFVAFKRQVRDVRRCGSAAIDLCLVADGTYDLYWEQKLQAWDMSAAAVAVLEAGGRLSDYDGAPADPRKGKLVASNSQLHEQALAVIRRASSLPAL
ncbi:MAG: inositol monophosphatase [Proteobacteria bacterium]|nr:inositol monophosphatase [Pseudomonadota bacterium]